MNKEYELKAKEKDVVKKKRKQIKKDVESKNTQLEKMQYFQLVLGNKMERIEIKEYTKIDGRGISEGKEEG